MLKIMKSGPPFEALHLKLYVKVCEKNTRQSQERASAQCILANVIALGIPQNLLLDSSRLPGESTRPQSHEGRSLRTYTS